jgi:5-methylthioribose kinase
MLELTVENVLPFCRERGWIGPGPAHAELLGGGVSNAVLRVESGPTLFVLKQSRPQLRTRDPWFSDVERIWREKKVMEVLRPLLPELTVPEVLHEDGEHFLFVMSHAPRASRVWKEQLLAGEVEQAVARHAGRVLGRIHQASSARVEEMADLRDRTVFDQLRTDPFYRRVQERRPEVARAIEPILADLDTKKEALCHGDFSPKNILVHDRGFTLVDYETAHLGDPAMDLGFFLSHLLLKACRQARRRGEYFALTESFWAGYAEEATFRPLAQLQARGIGHLGVCLLARIDGTSPVDYLPDEERRAAVRSLGRTVLLDRPGSWNEVLELAEGAYASLA